MPIKLISFGYKHEGPPEEAGQTFDCRHLRNPFLVQALRPLDGRDITVQQYVLNDSKAQTTVVVADRALKDNLTLAFGCHGGKHRSVAMVEHLAKRLRGKGHEVTIEHRALTIKENL
jgi:UPF0042 nucleotide-binding protein